MLDSSVLVYLQFFLTIVMGLYFWNLLKSQESHRLSVGRESKRELERLKQMRNIRLTEPLTEKTRPQNMEEIVGQEDGIRALRAALCGPNPQHVIIYGPPGVGKTAAARLVLEEAKKNPLSPFKSDAKFIEVDATTARFDERGIADPLIGSVHDPIYQGAGPLGVAGIPQPKPGAVTKAHGGILFLDEIGELHPIQMQKLLKVLEDRKVFLESAYYSRDDANIPEYIHDIFQNGLPADFRLVGATTRSPEDIPPALRSRCLEIFFRELSPEEIGVIARSAAKKAGVGIEEQAVEMVKKYAVNGRDAVNLVELAAGLVMVEGRADITVRDVDWIISQGHHAPRSNLKIPDKPSIGVALGLAVFGAGMATVIDIETQVVQASRKRRGEVIITGIIEEEELGKGNHTLRRKSMVLSSIENVRTALSVCMPVRPYSYDIHVNFPGGTPVDGPSAGLAIAVSMYSALTSKPVQPGIAFTGEISIRGEIRAVGGVDQKLRAAEDAGLSKVFIPSSNWQERFAGLGVEVVPVANLKDVLLAVFPESFLAAAPSAQ
ncbi:MAG TPA: ATP-dependent protease LonB [Firmicutes bacterium]|nr:ATP-dependent protease LonB [Candidatus Fermentithermobacillaceae bacterium]